jgi:hypothetical protein
MKPASVQFLHLGWQYRCLWFIPHKILQTLTFCSYYFAESLKNILFMKLNYLIFSVEILKYKFCEFDNWLILALTLSVQFYCVFF